MRFFSKYFFKWHFLILGIAGILTYIIWSTSSTASNVNLPENIDLPIHISSSDTAPNEDTQDPIFSEQDWQKIVITPGDNLTSLFKQVGLSVQDVYYVDKAARAGNTIQRIIPGRTMAFLIVDGKLQELRYTINKLHQDVITLNKQGKYQATSVKQEPDIKQRFVKGTIENSLYLDGQRAGLSQKKLMEMTRIFGWDIDFALDIRKGDEFALLYEEQYFNGEKIGEGNILAAQFINQGREVNAIRNYDGNYYNQDGYSMRKAFLRSPVDFYRISSKFNPKRLHPVLNVVRPHRGVDYAAPTGTPIKAAGDGRVSWKGTKNGYGQTIILQYAGIYSTLYAHMSAYNRKIKTGSRVKQGQIIGYVGETGLATGPHLHYEFRQNGVHKNPLKVKFPDAKPLNKEQMKVFGPYKDRQLALLDAYKQGTPCDSFANILDDSVDTGCKTQAAL